MYSKTQYSATIGLPGPSRHEYAGGVGIGIIGGFGRPVLSYLPATDSEKEAEDVGLLLLLKLFDVFEGAHLRSISQFELRRSTPDAMGVAIQVSHRVFNQKGCIP